MREEEREARLPQGDEGKSVGDDDPSYMKHVNSSTFHCDKPARHKSSTTTSKISLHAIYLSAVVFLLLSTYFYNQLQH